MASPELETFVEDYEAFQEALKKLHVSTEDLLGAGLGRDFEEDAEMLMRRVSDMVDDFTGRIFFFVDDRLRDWRILSDRGRYK